MRRKSTLSFGCLAALALLLASGCSLLGREEVGAPAAGGWYIQLRIQAPAASSKAITVTDFDVTALQILVLDPDGKELQTINWQATEDTSEPQTYIVPVEQLGEHQIEVTHFGQNEVGEQVQATESAAFQIRAMGITVIDIVPGCIGMIRIPESEGPEDGTITVRLSGADVYDGTGFMFGVLPAGTTDLAGALGGSSPLIAGGAAEDQARAPGTGTEVVVFMGGSVVNIAGWINLDGDPMPSSGDWYGTKEGVVVDGDTFVQFAYPADFQHVPEGPADWQLWGTWVNEEYNGVGGPPAKVVMHEDGTTELFWNTFDPGPFQTVRGELTGEWTDAQAHWFQSMVEGPIYVLTRLFDEGNTFTNRTSETGYPDPSEFGPDYDDYFVIYYRQE